MNINKQIAFNNFRKRCTNGVRVNKIYEISALELKEIISCSAEKLIEISQDTWEVTVNFIVDTTNNTNVLYIERIK